MGQARFWLGGVLTWKTLYRHDHEMDRPSWQSDFYLVAFFSVVECLPPGRSGPCHDAIMPFGVGTFVPAQTDVLASPLRIGFSVVERGDEAFGSRKYIHISPLFFQ